MKFKNIIYTLLILVIINSASGMDLDREYNEREVTIFEGKNKEKVSPVYSTGGYFGLFESVYPE
jgi:hypothetical protein